jgi:hypothetical protein
METRNNEPNGFNENQRRNESDLGNNEPTENKNSLDTDYSGNDIAGNAVGNIPEEEQTENDEAAIEKDNEHGEDTEQRGRGFMGDFAEPQHDD